MLRKDRKKFLKERRAIVMRAIALTCIRKETSWLFQRGKGKATHAKEAEVCGHHGGTDGTVGGFGVGFDVDDCFHIVRSLKLEVRS